MSRGRSTSPRPRAATRGRTPGPACPGPLDDGRPASEPAPGDSLRRRSPWPRLRPNGLPRIVAGATGLARLAGGRRMSPGRHGRPTGHDRVGAIRAAPSHGRRRQTLARVGCARAAGNHAGRLPRRLCGEVRVLARGHADREACLTSQAASREIAPRDDVHADEHPEALPAYLRTRRHDPSERDAAVKRQTDPIPRQHGGARGGLKRQISLDRRFGIHRETI